MSDTNATSVVNPRPVEHLYRLRGVTGELLYVGITNNWPTRMKQHMAEKQWWHEVAAVELVGVFGTRAQLEAIERAVIKTETPIYNVAHNGGARQAKVEKLREPMQVRLSSQQTSPFSIGDDVVLVRAETPEEYPGVGTVVERSGQSWEIAFPDIQETWRLCDGEIKPATMVVNARSLTNEETLIGDEQWSVQEWHDLWGRPFDEGWLVEHPSLGEGVVSEYYVMPYGKYVRIYFYNDDAELVLNAEFEPLKLVAK